MPFTTAAIDLYVSERVGAVTVCGASDIRTEFPSASHWISSLGMRSMFQAEPPIEVRHWAIQFVRHTEMALRHYESARTSLLDLVNGSRGRWSPYFSALSYFEDAIARLYQAFGCFMKAYSRRFFEPDDGSPLQKLNHIYNAIKHASAEAEQPVWITDTGISTEKYLITFEELESLLRECAVGAAAVARGKDAVERDLGA
jgi:hypothetical protein